MLGKFYQMRNSNFLKSSKQILGYLKKTKFCEKSQVPMVKNK